MNRYALAGALGLVAFASLTPRVLAQSGGPPSRKNDTIDASTREEIRREVMAEMKKEQELERQREEVAEMRREMAALRSELSAKNNQSSQPGTVDPSASRSGYSNPGNYNTQPAGPVANMRYAIPDHLQNTAAGYVVNYAGYNYLINSDRTMTWYTGRVITPTSTYVNPGVNYVTPYNTYYTYPNHLGYSNYGVMTNHPTPHHEFFDLHRYNGHYYVQRHHDDH